MAHSKKKKGIFISQQKCVIYILDSTPIDPNINLRSAKEDIAVDKEMYQRLVGRLFNYLTQGQTLLLL